MRKQREIKFRQWIGGKFEYWGVGIDGNTFVGPYAGMGLHPNTCPQMQFTGLLDKNGVEVYEGDVVKLVAKWGVIGGEVAMSEGCFGVKDGAGVLTFQSTKSTHWEVLGNIYENPELAED